VCVITLTLTIIKINFADIDSIPTKNLVRIIAPESNVFVGDKMLFTCLYEKFQIAREAKFAFQYTNGTIDFMEIGNCIAPNRTILLKLDTQLTLKLFNSPERQDDRYSFDLEKYQRSAYIKIASPDVAALMCFVPVWNSTVWKNTTFPLNVSSKLSYHKFYFTL
jgi:hypothetical protein